jgi:DNA-binding NarL/FixJ family response regulator
VSLQGEEVCEIRLTALTVHEDKQYFFKMCAAGAQGYLTKQAAAEKLVAAIRAVVQEMFTCSQLWRAGYWMITEAFQKRVQRSHHERTMLRSQVWMF